MEIAKVPPQPTLHEEHTERIDELQEQLALLSMRVEALERIGRGSPNGNDPNWADRPATIPFKAVKFPHGLRLVCQEFLKEQEEQGRVKHTRDLR